MAKTITTTIIILMLIGLVYVGLTSDSEPGYIKSAHRAGVAYHGTITDIDVKTGATSWSGKWTSYIVRLNNGSAVVLADHEFRRSHIVVGDKIKVYYHWSSGHIVEKD